MSHILRDQDLKCFSIDKHVVWLFFNHVKLKEDTICKEHTEYMRFLHHILATMNCEKKKLPDKMNRSCACIFSTCSHYSQCEKLIHSGFNSIYSEKRHAGFYQMIILQTQAVVSLHV